MALSEELKNQVANAAAAVSREPNDPLMRQLLFPANRVEMGYQSMFLSMAYFLKFKVAAAKENELKKYGVFLKSLDQFIIGAFIEVIDNDADVSVNLNFTFDEDKMKDIIDAGYATSIDDASFTPYVAASTTHVEGSNGVNISFRVMPEYIHTVYYLAATCLKAAAEDLVSSGAEDKTITMEGLFKVKGYTDKDGNVKVAIDPDETVKQVIKNDDENEVKSVA